jgi:hypothetical protein
MKWYPVPLLLLAAACATTASGPRRQPDLITLQEIEALEVATAYDVVQILRPNFLRTRGQSFIGDPDPVPAVVYLDGFQHGSTPESLRSILRTSVREIEYINSRDATTRYGTGHRGGAILVRTR